MDAINTGVHSVRISYPVRYIYDDSLYIGPSALPTTVGLRVSGKGWKLLTRYIRSFSDSPVYYTFSNPLKVAEIDTVQLKGYIAPRFQGFHVNFMPEEWPYELAFELKMQKVVHLKLDSARVDLMPGYAITSYVNMSPSLISLEGPSSEVKKLPDSLLIRVPDQEIRTNYESNIPLKIDLPASITSSHASVYVSFEVSELP